MNTGLCILLGCIVIAIIFLAFVKAAIIRSKYCRYHEIQKDKYPLSREKSYYCLEAKDNCKDCALYY